MNFGEKHFLITRAKGKRRIFKDKRYLRIWFLNLYLIGMAAWEGEVVGIVKGRWMTLNGLRRSYISANAGFNPRARETPAAYLPLIRSLQFPALSILQCPMRFYERATCYDWLLQLEILLNAIYALLFYTCIVICNSHDSSWF